MATVGDCVGSAVVASRWGGGLGGLRLGTTDAQSRCAAIGAAAVRVIVMIVMDLTVRDKTGVHETSNHVQFACFQISGKRTECSGIIRGLGVRPG